MIREANMLGWNSERNSELYSFPTDFSVFFNRFRAPNQVEVRLGWEWKSKNQYLFAKVFAICDIPYSEVSISFLHSFTRSIITQFMPQSALHAPLNSIASFHCAIYNFFFLSHCYFPHSGNRKLLCIKCFDGFFSLIYKFLIVCLCTYLLVYFAVLTIEKQWVVG